MGRDYRNAGNAEGVSRGSGESLRQKDLYRTHLWRESLIFGITKGETHTYSASCLDKCVEVTLRYKGQSRRVKYGKAFFARSFTLLPVLFLQSTNFLLKRC